MSSTQQHVDISDIADDIILLKNGGGALVLQVSAVNFGLLSEREQYAIISAFAQMLNSLSYAIQILIFSERLNISSYLALLVKAQQLQTNPLLSKMIVDYRQFIESTIKDNDVLDKKFYMIIPLYSLELGLKPSKQVLQQKIKTVLWPRRDQIQRQLSRVGLKSSQLNTKELIELFYDIYNGQFVETLDSKPINPAQLAVSLNKPQVIAQSPTFQPTPPPPVQTPSPAPNLTTSQQSKTHPFVVEELDENT